MNAFAHKDDKGKINLGNESDLTGIGDGTAFGAIKAINADLTDIETRQAFDDYDELKTMSGTSGDITVNNLNTYRFIILYAGPSTTDFSSVVTLPLNVFKMRTWSINEMWAQGSVVAYFKYVNDTTINISGSGMVTGIIGVK